MRIRAARAADADRIGDITIAAYRAGGHLPAGHPYERTLRDVMPRLIETIVAELDGTVVGAVTTCGPNGVIAEVCRTGEWEFRFLAVDPQHWSAGIGRRLIAACEERGRAAGASAVIISVSSLNDRGHAIYPRLGYRRLPERDWRPGEGDTVLLAYRKLLRNQPVA